MERRDEFPMKYFESLFLFVSSLAYFTNIMSILFTVPLLAFLIYERTFPVSFEKRNPMQSFLSRVPKVFYRFSISIF